MGTTPTTRWQVGAHRYLVRRLDHALVQRSTALRHDAARSRFRASMVGVIITVIGLAGCAALAFIRPANTVGDAVIVVSKSSGAMFVVEEGRLHPVRGLASARLFVGRADDPAVVSDEELARFPRGPAVGIDGAPQRVSVVAGAARSWSVCDDAGTATSVSVVPAAEGGGADRRDLDPDEAVLWSRSGATYLVYAGVRAAIDLRNTVVTRALGIDGARPVPVSSGLFDAVPEVPAVTPPIVEDAGADTEYFLNGRTVGSVVTVDLGDRSQHYVALRDGVQPIGPATAQLLRFSDSSGRVGVDAIAPDVIARAPRTAAPLPVSTFPDRPPRMLDVSDGTVLCRTWTARPGSDRAEVTTTAGPSAPGPVEGRSVPLAGADGAGDRLDSFYAPPGTTLYVATTGMNAEEVRVDSRFLIDDAGVRYGVPTETDADALGVSEPERAPWSVVALLPPGPVLTVDSARRSHDGLVVDPGAR